MCRFLQGAMTFVAYRPVAELHCAKSRRETVWPRRFQKPQMTKVSDQV